MSASFALPLRLEDLQGWRACARRFWLQRRQAGAEPPPRALTATPSDDGAIVDGPDPGVALRASFPAAVVIAPPRTPAEWAAAVRRTLDCLDTDQAPPEGWAIFGACLTSEDRVQVRIDVLACGERGLRLFKLRHASVGNEADVDTAALWTHVAARCGLRVQSVSLLLVDTDFIYPGHGCYAGLYREVDLAPALGARPVAAWLAGMRTTTIRRWRAPGRSSR